MLVMIAWPILPPHELFINWTGFRTDVGTHRCVEGRAAISCVAQSNWYVASKHNQFFFFPWNKLTIFQIYLAPSELKLIVPEIKMGATSTDNADAFIIDVLRFWFVCPSVIIIWMVTCVSKLVVPRSFLCTLCPDVPFDILWWVFSWYWLCSDLLPVGCII